jgi:hypothetical protein
MWESISSPSTLLELVEDQPVRLEHVLHAAGVLPPAVDHVRIHAQAAVDERLDGVRDLELAAPGRLDRAGGVEDSGGEHVDAHEREVRLRLRRLLDEPRHIAPVQLGDAVVLRIGHRREQDQGVGFLAPELIDEVDDAVAEQVVAQVHDERGVAEEWLRREHGVGEAERLVLLDVLDRDAEVGTVARRVADLVAGLRRDDDAHVPDAGGGHRLDAVEEHGLVRHRHELLGARVRERSQARPRTSGENQSLH